MRVVVVGAGLAGLTAATRLRAAGHDVVVFEAGRRVGGRARTVRDPFVEGQYVESGAEWVDAHHHRMRALLDRHGIGLHAEGQAWTTIRRHLFRDGRLWSADEVRRRQPDVIERLDAYEQALERVADGIVDPARPVAHPEAAAIDARSVADVIADCGLDGVALLFARRNHQGEYAAEPEQTSLLSVAQQRALQREATRELSGPVLAHRVRDGVGALAQAMALPLADVLHLGEAVTAISWDPSASDGVGVTTRQRRVDADHVVVTCSFVAVRDVDFEPELPVVLRRAVDELDYGTVTKTAIQYAERRWARGYATTETLAQRVYEPTADQPGTAGVLMAYGGGDGGRTLGELDEAARIERIAGELGAMYGDLGRRLGGFSRAWANERRFGGSYSNYGPGQVTAFWDEIRAPHGNLWIAGEHAATWCGYLEGAVESGERVAAEIDQR